MFAALGFADLSLRRQRVDLPLAALLVTRFYEACGMYVCHVVLLCTLLAAALIERDGQRVPWRLGIFALQSWAGCAPLAWPASIWRRSRGPTLLRRWPEWLAGVRRWSDRGWAVLAAGALRQTVTRCRRNPGRCRACRPMLSAAGGFVPRLASRARAGRGDYDTVLPCSPRLFVLRPIARAGEAAIRLGQLVGRGHVGLDPLPHWLKRVRYVR